MTANVETFRNAFAAHRAEMEAQAAERIRDHFAALVERMGAKRAWSAELRSVLVSAEPNTFCFFRIDEDRLAKHLARWSAGEIETAAAKLASKVGNLTNVTLDCGDTCRFTVTGRHPNGATVIVEQSQVVKWSSTGKLFVQWPARINVDGCFTPEAKYKTLVA